MPDALETSRNTVAQNHRRKIEAGCATMPEGIFLITSIQTIDTELLCRMGDYPAVIVLAGSILDPRPSWRAWRRNLLRLRTMMQPAADDAATIDDGTTHNQSRHMPAWRFTAVGFTTSINSHDYFQRVMPQHAGAQAGARL
jgi:hypothetical protein